MVAERWLDAAVRPTRKACLLNLLASLRVRPTLSDHLLTRVQKFFFVTDDRAFARVDHDLYDELEKLAVDPSHRELGRPDESDHRGARGKGRRARLVDGPPIVLSRGVETRDGHGAHAAGST